MGNLSVVDLKKPARAEIVEAARSVLDLAEKGELVDFCWCGTRADGSVQTFFSGTDDQLRRLASVSRLEHSLHKAMDNGSTLTE